MVSFFVVVGGVDCQLFSHLFAGLLNELRQSSDNGGSGPDLVATSKNRVNPIHRMLLNWERGSSSFLRNWKRDGKAFIYLVVW